MGRAPCCDKANVKRGPWSPEEDMALKNYVQRHGTGGNWIALPHKAGLNRCGKSCRLRWLNYLRPDIKHGGFTEEEDNVIYSLYKSIGSRWSVIASHLPGRTDNDVKNYWNTKLKKKFMAAETNLTTNANAISNKPVQLSSSLSDAAKSESSTSFPSTDAGSGYNLLESQGLFADPVPFSMPRFEEPSDFGVGSSSHDVFSSLPMDSIYSTWPASGGGEVDVFLDLISYGSLYDLPNGYGFQTVDVVPGLTNFSYAD